MQMISQRADYTFKYNKTLGKHGWLRLTPAYSVKLVHTLLNGTKVGQNILDPFSGTATTGLVAAEKGFNAQSYEINPFLIWLGNAKCKNYSKSKILDLKSKVKQILLALDNDETESYWQPPIFNIERWWSTETLPILSKLRHLIVVQFGEPCSENEGNLVWVAFCRLVIETSSAAFNHISMSFKGGTSHFDSERIHLLFEAIFNNIANSALIEIKGKSKVIETDSRYPQPNGVKFDKVITSPPYPNRMSYIRELRPYMYWTKFLDKASEAGELDWKAIGGTWGIATSRLKSWEVINTNLPTRLLDTYKLILAKENPNADLMALYVYKFFDDIQLHLDNLRSVLNHGAELHYIIGNSSFYGVFVDSEILLQDIMESLGYSQIEIKPIRKRNSNKGLIEYCVSAKWA
jgi:hypothetical protein